MDAWVDGWLTGGREGGRVSEWEGGRVPGVVGMGGVGGMVG